MRESGAKCGILLDASGSLLVRKGFTLIREIENLCALIAASRATTQAIAQILGQNEISVIFHQGMGDHIHTTDVGEKAMLTLIFDDRADLDEIHKVASKRVAELIPLLETTTESGAAHPLKIENLRSEADKKLGSLFPTPSEGDAQTQTG